MFWDKLKLSFFALLLIVITSCSTIPNFIEYGTSATEHNYNYRAIKGEVRKNMVTLSGVIGLFEFEKLPNSSLQIKANRDGY